MSDFKTKMHQIRFRLGLRPRPRWGAYSAPPGPLAGFGGPTSKGRGRGGEGREGEELGALLLRGGEGREGEDGREGNGGKGREGEGLKPPQSKFSGYGADD